MSKKSKEPIPIGTVMSKKEFGAVMQKVKDILDRPETIEVQKKQFMDRWVSSTKEQKLEIVRVQLKNITTTDATVGLVGRVKIKDDPEAFFHLVDSFYESYGMNIGKSLIDARDLIDEYGEMSIQDMQLFFKKFRFGLYGKLYGKLTFGLMMQYFDNFQKSVGYNLDISRDQHAKKFKELSRDEREWMNNNRPQNLE